MALLRLKAWIIALIEVLALVGLPSLKAEAQGGATAPKPRWLVVDIGIIGLSAEDVLKDAIQKAAGDGTDGIMIRLDTPGGSLENTRNMVKDIMASPLPIVVWVGPDGARAASAGAFITLAAHVAAMTKGSNIGAAHPIEATGRDIGSEDLRRKAENDTAAFMESIAKSRGRNATMAASFVSNSLAITAEEALEAKVIDLVAQDPLEVLAKIDGTVVTLHDKRQVALRSKDSSLEVYEKTLRQRFLEILSNPNLFYLLFVAGLLGLGFELTHPGAILPGVFGLICMILALIATSVIPISFGAMLLVVASIGFIIAEIFLPSFGILGIGGFIGFVIGSLLLVDVRNNMGLGVSYLSVASAALTVGAFALLVAYLVLGNLRRKVASGPEGMIGKICVAKSDFVEARGRVILDGEDWAATLVGGTPPRVGERLVVEALDGLNLKVRQL
jgi:membrane-bound serine protease (ClpP class)